MPRQAEVRFGERLTVGGEVLRSLFTSGPAIAWTVVFLLLPLLAIAFLSFMSRGTYGEWQFPLSLGNYKRLLGFGVLGFDPLYPKIIVRSLAMGAGTTIVCILASLPLAFFIAGLPARWKMLALTLLIIPFWTNLLIRTYAWQILLGQDGCLYLFPVEGFHAAAGELSTRVFADVEARAAKRLFFGLSTPVELDSSGRIVIPEELRARVGIEKDVVIVGVEDRAELWPAAGWNAYQREHGSVLETWNRAASTAPAANPPPGPGA